MDEQVLKFRVGVIVLASLIVLGIMMLLFGGLPTFVRGTYTLYIHFPEAPGVARDTPVRKSGILIGRVSDVGFAPEGGVLVTAKLDSKHKVLKNEDCRINASLLGDAVLEFVPSNDPSREAVPYSDGDRLSGTVLGNPLQVFANMQTQLTQGLGSITTAGAEVGKLAHHVNDILSTHDGQIQRIMNKTEVALDGLARSLEHVEGFFGDEKVREQLKASIADLPALMKETRAAINDMGKLVQTAGRNMENLEGLTKPLGERGPTIVANIDSGIERLDSLLKQFNEFGAALNRPDGSLRQIIENPELYQHLNAAAKNVEQLTCELRPIIRDARVFSDKIARHPEVFVRGVIMPSIGTK